MQWTFLVADDEDFLTSDNPVFFFASEGISSNKAELTLPLSSRVSLWANRNQEMMPQYFNASRPVVKELNRRVASNDARFVYSRANNDWVLEFACKGAHQINRLEFKQRARQGGRKLR
jgi:hypothetical protein